MQVKASASPKKQFGQFGRPCEQLQLTYAVMLNWQTHPRRETVMDVLFKTWVEENIPVWWWTVKKHGFFYYDEARENIDVKDVLETANSVCSLIGIHSL